MTVATLTRWGNSQGVRISKEACGMLGISVGAKAEVQIDAASSTVTLKFERPETRSRFARRQKKTLEELVDERGWDGSRVGGEWIETDVGAEVVQ